MKLFAALFGVFLLAAPTLAQNKLIPEKKTPTPEALMPKASLLYFRYDGLASHRRAYDKTILAGIVKDEMGDVIGEVRKLWKQFVAQEFDPANNPKAKEDLITLQSFQTFLGHAWDHGGVLSVEVLDLERRHTTMVFPQSANKKTWTALHRVLKAITTADGNKPKIRTIRGRKIYQAKWTPLGLQGRANPNPLAAPPLPAVPGPAAFPPGAVPLQKPAGKDAVKVGKQKTITMYKTVRQTRVAADGTKYTVDVKVPYTVVIPATTPPTGVSGKEQKKPATKKPGQKKPAGLPNNPVLPVPPPPLPGQPKQALPFPVVPVPMPAQPEPAKPTKPQLLSWWKEGTHVVVVVGTEPVERTLDIAEGKLPSLVQNRDYQKLTQFKNYETHSRGFLDLKQSQDLIIKSIQEGYKLATIRQRLGLRLLFNQLGVTSLKNLSWHWGFEGPYLRNTIALSLPARNARRGLLRMVSAPIPSNEKDLPPLPPDAMSVSIHHFDWQRIWQQCDTLYKTTQILERLSQGNQIFGAVKKLADESKTATGIDVENDFLAHLDSLVVSYKARSEGLFFLGRGLAIKVKNAKKVEQAMVKLCEAVNKLNAGVQDFRLLKRKYRGATIHIVHMKDIPLAPSFTVHDGWLVVALLPQNLKAFLWRSQQPVARWKMPKVAYHAIRQGFKTGHANTKLGYLTVSDPRPLLELLLPLAPVLAQSLNSEMGPGRKLLFDVHSLPHARAITSKLTPNATAFFDDDTSLRWESHTSLTAPSLWQLYVLSELGESIIGPNRFRLPGIFLIPSGDFKK